jgi:hypothetical protein
VPVWHHRPPDRTAPAIPLPMMQLTKHKQIDSTTPSPNSSPTSTLALPVSLPSCDTTAELDGAEAFSTLENLCGHACKLHIVLFTSPLQLSSSDSEIVLTPPGCGFDAGLLSTRPWLRSERAFFYIMAHFRSKAANCISDVRDATNSIHPWVCVARRPRSCVGGVMDAMKTCKARHPNVYPRVTTHARACARLESGAWPGQCSGRLVPFYSAILPQTHPLIGGGCASPPDFPSPPNPHAPPPADVRECGYPGVVLHSAHSAQVA